eukprot:4211118-Amphidinium_carterae.1
MLSECSVLFWMIAQEQAQYCWQLKALLSTLRTIGRSILSRRSPFHKDFTCLSLSPQPTLMLLPQQP